MIPNKNYITETTEVIPSNTYFINFSVKEIQNKITGLNAIKQAIYMMLNTEKKAFTIYPLDYGVSFEKYIGQHYDFITGDAPREIKESLLKDNRILDVTNFKFSKEKEKIFITFTVVTVYGEIDGEVLL